MEQQAIRFHMDAETLNLFLAQSNSVPQALVVTTFITLFTRHLHLLRDFEMLLSGTPRYQPLLLRRQPLHSRIRIADEEEPVSIVLPPIWTELYRITGKKREKNTTTDY